MEPTLKDILDNTPFRQEPDFLPGLFGAFAPLVRCGEIPVALFGTGAVGTDLCRVLQLHRVAPSHFCDNDPAKVHKEIMGVPVIPFTQFKATCRDHLIVVASCTYGDEIRDQLLANGFPCENIISIASIRHPELLGYFHYCEHYTHFPEPALAKADLEKVQERILTAYSLLADEKSREIFSARMSLLTSELDFSRFSSYITKYSELNEKERAAFPFYVSPENYGYFNNELITFKEREVLIDGGSFNGLSAATFAMTLHNRHLSHSRIYCLEPDAENFRLLQETTSHLKDVTCIDKGLWSSAATLTLLSASEGDPAAMLANCTVRSAVGNSRATAVQTVSIDERFHDEDVTFIKLDIEGAETEALLGASDVIRRCRPKLAVSAYHRHCDIYELPLLIEKICPGYRYYLRHYGYALFDLVLFAVQEP